MKLKFLSKQGIFFRSISLIIQSLIISPITFTISCLFAYFSKLFNFNSENTFFISFIIISVVWNVKNSFVIYENGKIVFRDLIGKKQTINCTNINSLRVLNSSEFRKMILNETAQDPLISNCSSLLLPLNNIVTFKNNDFRQVAIGVWNYRLLFECIEKYSLQEDKSLQSHTVINCKSKRKCVKWYFVKMPFHAHITLYFKNFVRTVIIPLIISSVLTLSYLFSFDNSNLKFLFIPTYIIISTILYWDIILIVENENVNAIRLNFINSDYDNIIKYNNLKNLHYVESEEESKTIINSPNTKLIKTPHPYTCWKDVICFDTHGNTKILLSVSNSKSLYEKLKKYENNE